VSRRLAVLVAALALVLGLSPASAIVSVPLVMSDNLTLLGQMPDVGAISTAFDPDAPIAYVSTLHGVDTYDISDPARPQLLGSLPLAIFQNENVKFGQRTDPETGEVTEKFVLLGSDLYTVTPTTPTAPAGLDYELFVVDVTDPTDPHLRGRTTTTSSTHTMSCISAGCEVAYTSGAYERYFSIIDLSDLDDPREVAQHESAAGSGHDWDVDAAGIAWHVGTEGIAAYDITDPLAPVLVGASSSAGRASASYAGRPWNNFILHNSLRPEADAFTSRADDEVIPLVDEPFALDDGLHARPVTAEDIRPGEVLLVTEEDYVNFDVRNGTGRCGDYEGTFATWHIQQLGEGIVTDEAGTPVDGREAYGRGAIAPLDTWNTEIMDSGTPTPAGAFCSAHYFDHHQDGFVAQGWYQQGLRILDVRDATDIKQVGYFFTGATETWGAYWVPEYDEDGQTGRKTNIVYTNDPTKGIEILEVDLPDTAPADTAPLRAPILPQWLVALPEVEARATSAFGLLCRLLPT
jgi:hypothetical protein